MVVQRVRQFAPGRRVTPLHAWMLEAIIYVK